MISLSYSCTNCSFRSADLTASQQHANSTKHVVAISGTLTAQGPSQADLRDRQRKSDFKAQQQLLERQREKEILRRARDKGLLNDLPKVSI